MTSDSAAETTDQEKKNSAKGINSRLNDSQQSSSKNERSLVQISAQNSGRVPPNADDEADGDYVCESASQMVSPAKEDLASENSFISTNTSFGESTADVNQRPTNSRRVETLGNPPSNRPFMDHHSSATMATVESTSANFSLCSSPADSKFARDYSNDRASFTMESSSDDRTHGYDNGDDDDDDGDDDDEEEDSGSSVRKLSRHLRSSLAVESDLSESVVWLYMGKVEPYCKNEVEHFKIILILRHYDTVIHDTVIHDKVIHDKVIHDTGIRCIHSVSGLIVMNQDCFSSTIWKYFFWRLESPK